MPSKCAKFYQEGISSPEIRETFKSQFGVWYQTGSYLLSLTDLLDFPRPKSYLVEIGPVNGTIQLYSMTHDILLWKRVLVYLVPGLQHVLALMERVCRYACLRSFEIFDGVHKWPHKNKMEAILAVVLIYDEIKHLTDTETSDHSVVDHLKEILQNCLQVLCSRAFNFDESKVNISKEFVSVFVAMMVSCQPELASYVPPRYRGYIGYLKSNLPTSIRAGSSAKPLELPACLLRRFDGSKYRNDNIETKDCCCGRTFDSIPASLLFFCDCSAQSFASYIHSDLRETGTDEFFNPPQALKTVFKGAWKEESLHKRKVVFGSAVVYWVRIIFCGMSWLLSKLDSPKGWKCPDDQLDRVNKKIRRHLLTCILRSAVTMYHEFCNSYKSQREGETDAEDDNDLYYPESTNEKHRPQTTNKIYFHLHVWAGERANLETVTRESYVVLRLFQELQRIQAEFSASNDDDAFSRGKLYLDKQNKTAVFVRKES